MKIRDLLINRRFFNITQVVGTHHSRIICNEDLSKYKKDVNEVLIDVLNKNRKQHKGLMVENCSKKITLRARIYDSLLGNIKK